MNSELQRSFRARSDRRRTMKIRQIRVLHYTISTQKEENNGQG